MTRFLESNRDVDVLSYLREWVAVMADGGFGEAHRWLYRADDFTPEDLPDWIFRVRSEYRAAAASKRSSVAPKVTDPKTLDLNEERFMIDVLEKPDANGREVSAVEYFIPLDGEWSPMRASFFLHSAGEGRYGLELTDISMV